MSTGYLGRAVLDGVVRFLSVGAVEKFDPRANGCPRKYWYRYVQGIKDLDDAKPSVIAGKGLHTELFNYLRTGVKALSALAASGLHMVPDPGEDLLLEQSIGGPENPFLTADGISFVGFIDCAHDRCINKGGDDFSQMIDPPGTIEVIDWKWKRDGSKTEFILEPGELIKSVQMSGYGVFVARAFPSKTHVRLSHGIFPATRGKPRKVTRLHVIDDALRSWEYVDGLARSIKHVARETDPERVDANTGACGSYGGCPHRSICTAYKRTSVSNTSAMIFGETAAKELAMGLMQTLPPNLQQVTPGPAYQQPTMPAVDLRLQLQAEENAQRATVQAAQRAPLDFPAAWAIIMAGGRGNPALGGAAAQAYATMAGQQLTPGAGYAGTGDLGAIMFLDPAHVIQLGTEMRGSVAASTPVAPVGQQTVPIQHYTQPASVQQFLPPDAPASNPALAAKPLETTPGQIQTAIAGTIATAPTAIEVPKAKRGRKPKIAPEPTVSPAYQPAVSVPAAVTIPSAEGPELAVFVDSIPNCEFESIAPYVDHLLSVLSAKFNPGGLQDVRCAPKDSPLGFGGWRGAVRAIVIEQPPTPAAYFIDTRGNELMCEVADAMRVVAEKSNALYVRGVR